MSPHEPPGMPCEPKNSPKCLEVLQGFKSILRHCNALFFTYMVECQCSGQPRDNPQPHLVRKLSVYLQVGSKFGGLVYRRFNKCLENMSYLFNQNKSTYKSWNVERICI